MVMEQPSPSRSGDRTKRHAAPYLIRGEYVIADPSAGSQGVIRDGAVVIDGGRIVAMGPWSEVRRTCGHLEPFVGAKDRLVLPGLVNAHHHGRGISTLAMGIADRPLELWSPSLMLYRGLDHYTNTLYAAARMLLSGVTTSIHSHYYVGPPQGFRDSITTPLTAYRDAGSRVGFAVGISDQHYLAYVPNRALADGMPAALARDVERWFAPSNCYIGIEEYLAVFDAVSEWCVREYPLGRLMLSPRGFQWASEALLRRVAGLALERRVGVQFHFLETRYQRTYVSRNLAGSAVEALDRAGLLGPHLSLAHAVWVDEADLDRLVRTGTTLVTNTSSNLRLGSSLIPLRDVIGRGINVAVGLDSLTLAEDEDMFSEMRLLGSVHRKPGLGTWWPSPYKALEMATVGGACAAGLEGQIGRLHPGYHADVVVLDLKRLRAPYVDPHADVPALALSRARAADVDTVLVDGQVLVRNGTLVRIDLRNIEARLAQACRAGEEERDDSRRAFVGQLQEHLRAVYAGWDDDPPGDMQRRREG